MKGKRLFKACLFGVLSFVVFCMIGIALVEFYAPQHWSWVLVGKLLISMFPAAVICGMLRFFQTK